MLLGLAGAAVGLLAIPPSVGVLTALAPPTLPRLPSIQIDAPTLLVTIAFVLIAIVVFSAIASAPRRSGAIRLAVDATAYGISERRAGGGLVMFEIAVALTLGIMATLMARSVVGLRSVNMGFDADGVVAARLTLTEPAANGPAATAVFDELLARLRATPGVESAGMISTRPLNAPGTATLVSDPGRPRDTALNEVVADIRYANATLFETLQIPVLAGATFDTGDHPDRPITVVVSESLARTFWPNQSAIGRDLHLELYKGITGRVIGVVGDVHFVDARTPVRAAAYPRARGSPVAPAMSSSARRAIRSPSCRRCVPRWPRSRLACRSFRLSDWRGRSTSRSRRSGSRRSCFRRSPRSRWCSAASASSASSPAKSAASAKRLGCAWRSAPAPRP